MRNPIDLIQRFTNLTGIRDPKIDTWFSNQALYAKHGMEHPALPKKREPERRSRSPLLPGPRKTKSVDEELFEKWMDANYPEQLFPRHRYSDYVTQWGDSSWRETQVLGFDKDAFVLVDEKWFPSKERPYVELRYRIKPKGVGVIRGIRPWDKHESTYTYRTNEEYEKALKEQRRLRILEEANLLHDATIYEVLEGSFRFKWESEETDDERGNEAEDI